MSTTPKRARRKRVELPELDAGLSTTTNPTQESTESTSPKSTPTGAGYQWPNDPAEVLAQYLAERTSAEQDAPNRRRPFVAGGVLRVHPTNWTEWLESKSISAPKKDALQVLKDAGLVQKVYALPGESGKSAGFYTGKSPVAQLPERVVERKSTRAPRSPFGKLTDEQHALLHKVLLGHKAKRDQVLRDQLLAHLESSAN